MSDPEVTSDNRFHARQSVPGDYVQTLLNSLTLDQIRDAAYLLAPTMKIAVRNHTTSREAITQTRKSMADIKNQLLRIEALQPFKHCLFFKCVTAPEAPALQDHVDQSFSNKGITFRVANVFDTGKALVVTIEHLVEVKEWVKQENEDIKRLESRETRHPIVLRVLKNSMIGSLNYPGFSQGQGTRREKVLQYDEVLTAALGLFTGWGIDSRSLSVKDSLRVLLSGGNTRVHRYRADVEALGVGRFDLASASKQTTIEESVVKWLGLDVDEKRRLGYIEATRKALNDADTNSVLLFWQQEKIVTRLRFWDIGCEILFVWGGETQNYDIVDPIVEVLAGAHERIGEWIGNDALPLQWIASLPQGTIKQPGQLAETLNLKLGEARSEFAYAVKAGLVKPVYRLKTNEIIPDYENVWSPSLAGLMRVFETDSGALIDGTDLNSVEVAFRRVGNVVGASN